MYKIKTKNQEYVPVPKETLESYKTNPMDSGLVKIITIGVEANAGIT